MLHKFLTLNRELLIERCKEKVAKRFADSEVPLIHKTRGVPVFLQQLMDSLRDPNFPPSVAPIPAAAPAPTEIGRAAALHGAELLRLGYSIDEVVHDYGDVCQSVTELAIERSVPISVLEFRTLNMCIDNAIADAVTAFSRGEFESGFEASRPLHRRVPVPRH
jgi:hypothetical protein